MTDPTPPDLTPTKTPAPPKTKSGEIPAVQEFERAVEKYGEETAPELGEKVERMERLRRKVTNAPPGEETAPTDPVIPVSPRTPSNVDPEESGSL